MGVTRRAVLAGGVVAGVASGRTRRARAEAPVIKVGVLTDLSGPYRDINGPQWHRLREASRGRVHGGQSEHQG